MGVELDVVHGFIEARTNRLSGARVVLEFPSVGATENLLTAAVLAKGQTVIENAAREPELTDLADMLNRMGAEIHGAGTSTLTVEGVEELGRGRERDHVRPHRDRHAADGVRDRRRRGHAARGAHRPRGDGGDEAHRDGPADHADARRAVGRAPTSGCARSTSRRCRSPGSPPTSCRSRSRCSPPPTAPPSSPRTCSTTGSVSSPSSTAWAPTSATRVGTRWSAGSTRLSAAPVRALDVRAGAALVLAGLAADGETVVLDPFHVDRGYSDLAASLRTLGADVERVRDWR